MQHSYEALDRPGGVGGGRPSLAAAPPRLPRPVGRDGGLAPRRRDLPDRGCLGGVLPLERAGSAGTRRHRNDRADDPLPRSRRGRERPPRPADCHAHRRRRPGGGCRRSRAARAHRLASVLGARGCSGRLRRCECVLHSGVRRRRSRSSPVGRPGRRELARPVRAADRSPPRRAGGGRRCSCPSGRALRSRSTPPRSRFRASLF